MWNASPAQTEQKLLQEFYLTEEEKAEHERERLEAQKAKKGCCHESFQLRFGAAVLVLALVVSSVVERVTFKVMVDKLENYRFFLMEMVVATNAVIMLIVLVYKRLRTNDISAETTAVSKWHFVLMALMDTCAMLLTVIPGGRVPAPLTVLLLQALTPASLLVAVAFRPFRAKFHWLHHTGALAIAGGVVVAILPIITTNDLGSFTKETQWNCVMYICAAIPAALSAHYKESVIANQQMSQFYLNFWVSLFQFIAGIVVAPLALPMQRIMDPAGWDSTGWRLMAKNWRKGASCLFAGADSTDADFCWMALIVVIVYVVATFSVGFVAVALLSSVSIRTVQFAIVAAVPVAMVCLEWYNATSAVAKRHGVWPAWCLDDFMSLGLIVVGMVLYHVNEEPGVSAETPMPDNYATAERAQDTGLNEAGNSDDDDDDDSDGPQP